MAMAITEAAARYEVFTKWFPVMVVIDGRLHSDERRQPACPATVVAKGLLAMVFKIERWIFKVPS
jgi:hypothetical protein